tara:strand:- start:58 stop:288 length:231 start_codon:yes stop_codon:yes gene_type:complete
LLKEKNGDRGATLGAAVKKSGLHKSLRAGIEKLWGWASEENGVRHGSPGSLNVFDAQATLALVICSGIVNLLRAND